MKWPIQPFPVWRDRLFNGFYLADHICLIAYGWGLPTALDSGFIDLSLTKRF